MLQRAQQIISSYQDDEKINFGANIQFLELLFAEESLIFSNPDDDFRQFIESNEEKLEKVCLLNYLSKDNEFNQAEYLSAIGISNHILENENDDENEAIHKVVHRVECIDDFSDFFSSRNDIVIQELIQDYKKIGFEKALKFDLNLKGGHQDYYDRAEKIRSENPLTSAVEFLHKLDNVDMDAEWPCTQMAEGLYAFQGFTPEKIKASYQNHFSGAGFFYEFLHNDVGVVVALGNSGDESKKHVDFSSYFTEEKEYIKYDDVGWPLIKVLVKPELLPEVSDKFSQHVLNCYFEIFDKDKNEFIKKTKQIVVVNVPMADGTAIDLDPKSHIKLISFLLENLHKKTNIAVHCHAGRGRTGQLLAELLLIEKFMEIFSEDNSLKEIRQQLHDLIQALRDKRAGMLLEYLQILKCLIDSLNFVTQAANKDLNVNVQEKQETTDLKKRSLSSGSDSQILDNSIDANDNSSKKPKNGSALKAPGSTGLFGSLGDVSVTIVTPPVKVYKEALKPNM